MTVGAISPDGSYSQHMPPRCATCGLPPHLPPLLQLTVLNQEPPNSVSIGGNHCMSLDGTLVGFDY